jgi:tetratricopeptide (TPR) repeat protein
MTAGQETQAREILVSGLQQSDDPLLRKALSELDIVLVDRRLAESPLNRDACGPVVLEALRRDPSCLPAVQALVRLHLLGLEISPTSIEKTVSHWQAVISDDSENLSARILLSQLHLISGDHAQSAEVIRPAVAERPELRLTLADRLLRSGENSESTQLLETLIEEAQATLKKTPDDVGSLSQLAEAQLTLGRAEDVRALLAKKDAELGQSRIPDDAALAAIYGRACLKNFDQLTGYVPEPVPSQKMNHGSDGLDSTAEAALVLELLDDAFACKSTSHQAIDRLSRLSLSDHPAATGAEDMLRQLRLEGTYGAQVLNLLGMHALMMNRFDKARPYLEQANIQTRGRDPMILNNLATALVRSGESKERALQLANETLTFIPDHPDALSTRGEVYVALERWPEALADLTQSLKFRQKSAELHRLLEKAYTGLADPSMAEEHRERAKELEAQTKHDG